MHTDVVAKAERSVEKEKILDGLPRVKDEKELSSIKRTLELFQKWKATLGNLLTDS